VEAVCGSKESGAHWSPIGFCKYLVLLDTIAAYVGALVNFRAELARAMHHRRSQLGPPDAQSAR
jgi:hypothetical protein